MSARAGSQDGFSLIELLIVMTLSLIMLSAVLVTFDSFITRADRNAQLNDAQASTRVAVEQLARDLRNLASPSPEKPQAIDSAAPYDLIFQTVNPAGSTTANKTNVQRVRYCLDAPASDDATLWAQTQTWNTLAPAPMPGIAGCPSTSPGWTSARVLAKGVTNREGGRPLFLYNAATKTDITAIATQLWSRTDKQTEPRVGLLRTQVYLRNQNQAPVASFTATTNVGTGRVILNASASRDAEEDELRYDWYLNQTPDCRAGTPPTPTGSGVVYNMNTGTGTKTITLIVYDSAGLCTSQTQTVVVAS
ncbi:MAG TPA: PKD domain-containing protein [Solirubrobacteraceae bacterium]|nr:PKD domain-containing protein [Solirubrobacteraceae bacterium]